MARRRSGSYRRKTGPSFRLSPPTNQVFLTCLAVVALGIVGHLIEIPVITAISFWLVAGGAVLLLLACLFSGL